MKKTIFIFTSGELQRKDNTLFFEGEKGRKFIPVENTKEMMIFGEVSINKKLLEFLSQKEIILHFFNYYGYYSGTFYPREHYNSGYMILQQAKCYLDEKERLLLARKFVEGAVSNIKRVLKYYNSREADLEELIRRIDCLEEIIPAQETIDSLMAIEGNIRDLYYNSFDLIIGDKEFTFNKRSRRPPLNRLNALISFGNSLLYTIVLSEIYKTHLDPRISFLHTTNFRRFSLNLDVAEIFKPIIIDRLIFYLVNKKVIQGKHFLQELSGIYLNENGNRIFAEELDKKLQTTIYLKNLDKQVSYRRLIRLELYKVEKHLMGEAEYKPFVAQW